MTDLPRCKLCQCASFRMLAHETVIHPTDKSRPCALNGIEVTPEQWTALMGVDQDGVRYRKFRRMVGSYPTPSGEAFLFPTVHGMPAPTIAILDPAKGLDDALDAMGEQQ